MQAKPANPEVASAERLATLLGAIVRTRPLTLPALRQRLAAKPGVEVALDPGDGRLVLLLEDSDGASAQRRLAEIGQWPEVMSATLVYEHSLEHAPA